MMNYNVNGEFLGFIFNRLRLQEGKNTIGSLEIDNQNLFKILFNAKYKKSADIPLTNLEETAIKEAGLNINMYVEQKFKEAKKVQ